MSNPTSDSFDYAGLYQDTEYEGDHAWYRNLSTEQIRWLSPDPDNGSYNLMDPQSLNRYSYVDNSPQANSDPSGLSFASTVCSMFPAFALSTASGPLYAANNAVKLAKYGDQIASGSCSGPMALFGGAYIAATSLSEWSGAGTSQIANYLTYIQTAVTIACSISYDKSVCGDPQLAWLIPGANGDVGKAVADTFALGASLCAAGALGNPLCEIDLVYQIANGIYNLLYNIFGWGPAQFTGSLLPRPTDLGGLGTAPTGIPNQNLTLQELLGKPPASAIPLPGALR